MRQASRREPRNQRAAWLHRQSDQGEVGARRIDNKRGHEDVQFVPQRTTDRQSLDLEIAEAVHRRTRIDWVRIG